MCIDREVCIGSGNCVRFAGEVFDQDAEAIVVLLQDEPAPELHEAVRQAAAGCPTGAIEVS